MKRNEVPSGAAVAVAGGGEQGHVVSDVAGVVEGDGAPGRDGAAADERRRRGSRRGRPQR